MSRKRARPAEPYSPRDVEGRIYRRWERAGAFAPSPRPRRGRKPFVIVIPPPNVTGSLHMGHALQDTIMDVLTRYHRMRGDDTLCVPGTDHAGIATQNVVERELKKEGLTRHDLGREKFLERVWAWKEQYGGIITAQLRELGFSCDWSRQRFTLDDRYVRAVQEAFIHYARKGLIYRGRRIVNWCPRCASSISDLEVRHEERDGTLYFIRYPRVQRDGKTPGIRDSVTVATTRPETLLGDTAVAVHPDDARYHDLVGAQVRLPLTEREIPIIADRAVDQSFGTGAVKVTPAHDHQDAEIGERYGLPAVNVIGEDARMTAEAGASYRGLSPEEARRKVLDDLRMQHLLEKEERIRHSIAVCDRCGTPIQPLQSLQWFVTMASLAAPAIAAITQDLVAFHPPRWKKVALDWLRNVKDWCISRQLWWGHRLPVWYCQTEQRGAHAEEKTHVVFSLTKPTRCPTCGGTDFIQDSDVLDTWFSSALWPFAVFGWPETTADLRRFYPTSVLTTAPEILYLWVTRMIFSALEFMDGTKYLPAKHYGKRRREQQVPFQNVILHPTVLTLHGKRMSKSKGIVVDPLELIHRYGADATRFGLLLQLRLGQQALRFDEHAVESARNFVNKVWNVGRFLRQTEAGSRRTPERSHRAGSSRGLAPFDAWATDRLNEVAWRTAEALNTYHIGEAARMLHDFVWDDVADWYVEASKVPGSTSPAVGRRIFAAMLQLLHPFIPFVTEALWQELRFDGLLAVSPWLELPAAGSRRKRASAHADIMRVQQAVRDIRSARALLGIPSSVTLTVRIPRSRIPRALLPTVEFLARCRIRKGRPGQTWVPLPTTRAGPSSPTGAGVELAREHLRGLDLETRRVSLQHTVDKLKTKLDEQTRNVDAMRGKASPENLESAEATLVDLRTTLATQEAALQALARFAASVLN